MLTRTLAMVLAAALAGGAAAAAQKAPKPPQPPPPRSDPRSPVPDYSRQPAYPSQSPYVQGAMRILSEPEKKCGAKRGCTLDSRIPCPPCWNQ